VGGDERVDPFSARHDIARDAVASESAGERRIGERPLDAVREGSILHR
jgi:hypothetical protein